MLKSVYVYIFCIYIFILIFRQLAQHNSGAEDAEVLETGLIRLFSVAIIELE